MEFHPAEQPPATVTAIPMSVPTTTTATPAPITPAPLTTTTSTVPDATANTHLTINFGTQENYEAFRKHVREDPTFLKLRSQELTDWWLVKFFDGARGNTELALKMLERTLQWRIDYKYSSLRTEDFSADHATGKLYFHHFTKDSTPVLIWRICRHKADPKNVEHTVRFIVSFLEKGTREGIITSRLTLLIDRVGSVNENVEGIAFFRSLTHVLQTHFPEMLQRLVIFPTNWLLWTVWKVVKPFLDASVVERLSLLGPKEYKQVLQDLISAEHLSPRYGGTSVDWTEAVGGGGGHVEESDDDDPHIENGKQAPGRDSGVSVSAVSLDGLHISKKADHSSSSHSRFGKAAGGWGVGSKMRRMFKDAKEGKEGGQQHS
ncbi:CRAL-TRIO domain-containing protein [Fimicolochytrium jonesii]|uniref:CRAL-TRIO domain-containing protein n=1 Tax=Fimicolochytrium jonesii TaxID=1396493 RepID=UPI0022FDE346|nr:CRAL-TRIO domain-containing protein [Fimicolochytrium jonesii]KAI8821290.1 CRAL-TRIO domain-containing protein [Fimicolochytrium jonesii]